MHYGQFCPIAKASEVLGERWMLLVLRELVTGATRYGELQRGLGRISPSVLSARLKSLQEHGVVEKVEADDGSGTVYRLTPSGQELSPIIASIGVWGQRWVRSRMTRDELDVELLMSHIRRGLNTTALPAKRAVLRFDFVDLSASSRRWWLLVEGGRVELCAQSPGRPEDVTVSCRLKVLSQVWVGDTTVPKALAAGELTVEGKSTFKRSLRKWLGQSDLAPYGPAAVA